jgi:hypothetical protein
MHHSMKRNPLVIVVLHLALLPVLLPAQEPSTLRLEDVQRYLKTAEQQYSIRITEEARELVQGQLHESLPRLQALVSRFDSEEQSLFLSTVVGWYLSELRDEKIRRERRGSDSPPSLEREDVDRLPVRAFLQRELPSEAIPKSFLVVTSHPLGAEIHIDGSYKGLTNKPFVVPPGTHSVRITNPQANLNCVDSVRAERNKQAVVRCPPQP